jgi:SIT4-associating protein SAP185/190
MFWRFGGYANISTIDTILDKADFGLEELLDENDLVQEIKQHNSKLIEYLRQDHILERLLDYVVAPKLAAVGVTAPECEPTEEEDREKERERTSRNRMLPFSRPRAASKPAETDEEEQEKKRNRYAYISAEVLASDTWSIYEALLESPYLIRNFWKFLQRDTPLDPLQASYFTKVNEALFEKKTHDMTQLFMSIPGSVQHLLRHVECPMIMDLLLKIVSMDRNEGGQGIVEWLYHEQLMPGLIAYLSPKNDWVVQTSACEIIKAIITISANASQNEQTCIGPNELTRQLVSRSCVEEMIGYMLSGGNALTTGVSIVIEVIRKNNSDYDPDVCADASGRPSSRDPIYLGTLLRLFAENVPNFMALMANVPAQHVRLDSTFGHKIEPLGVDRFKTCELMAELLHCSNMGLLNELGAEEMVGVRDAERQRLRAEGKLPHHRGGDEVAPAAEDMTLRSSHSPEEGRRLEVTNIADDDGFEEVEHSREMNEDTSHEFVKAEEDIPALPASSLLDKDDDDFVDEPLNSPQMQPKTEGSNVPQFEMPELVVAPLSPKKRVVQDVSDGGEEASSKSGGTEDEKATLKEDSADVARAQTPELSLEKLVDRKLEIKDSKSPEPAHTQEAESEKTAASADVSDSPPEGAAKDGEQSSNGVETSADKPAAAAPESVPASTTDSPATQVDTTIRPHPEDMPAPLFSPQKSNPAEAHPQPLGSEDDSVDLPEYSAAGVGQDDSGMPDSSTFITNDTLQPVSEEPARQQDALQQAGPVVGDLLKSQFVTHDVVPTILSFFFRYPWNNFLHNVVYDIIQQVFNGPMDRGYNPMLAISLFDDAANITASIVKGQAASDEHQVKMKTRLGYMGHLTLIAEEVVKFTERHPPEMLSDTVMDKVMSVEWINYVEGSLADTRERDNAILGGVRPDVAMNNRMSMTGNTLSSVSLGSNTGSNALAEAGLNGAIELNDNGSGGIGPFAISSGALISGFGSSSDEEDEDNEENEEDVNNEVSGTTFASPESGLLS